MIIGVALDYISVDPDPLLFRGITQGHDFDGDSIVALGGQVFVHSRFMSAI